ncbi:hypothetical protein LTR78_005764 [Recurvomyces mirabilis]|uniref:RNA-dependent RNA polymerase n=1 Tax=Recurvomyces mirabilis TaxID=574656 RepID=A0AAE0WM77_9PEZI|nr:hypothetical protein LTR78_005764 [Recurvomyces mirabilis]KAK5154143.1 hypothetical protein LTS14_006828 [Recurvomyces mirabilis]
MASIERQFRHILQIMRYDVLTQTPHPLQHNRSLARTDSPMHQFQTETAAAQPSPPRRTATQNAARPPRPPARLRSPPLDFSQRSSVKVSIIKLPEGSTTWDLYNLLSSYGNICLIELFTRSSGLNGYVVFRPPPHPTDWITKGINVKQGRNGEFIRLDFRVDSNGSGPRSGIQTTGPQPPVEQLTLQCQGFDAGIMQSERCLAMLFSSASPASSPIQLITNAERKKLELHFSIGSSVSNGLGAGTSVASKYKIEMELSQIKDISVFTDPGKGATLLIDLAMPPLLHRQTSDIRATHDPTVTRWNEFQAWFRQCGIDRHAQSSQATTQLRSKDPLLDVGRWLTYSISLATSVTATQAFSGFGKIVHDNNVKVIKDSSGDTFTTVATRAKDMWSWVQSTNSSLSALHAMLQPTNELEFAVRYQLEVCLSQGVIKECNITEQFVAQLSAVNPIKAEKLLQKVADKDVRIFEPMHIFRMLGEVSMEKKKIPSYCAMIPSAVITPTTIYFATPVMETSNRVIRDNREIQDHFLRVKFTNERYRGKIMNADDPTENEVFHRIQRTMTNGIKLGDRHYEFLAFGNSQFRENGAYFFAASGDITADSIRAKMGNFEKLRDRDRNVAKYASRLGQCFSTTRGMSVGVAIQKIEDVYGRDGTCFTDGVGKLSVFLAQMMAQELGLPNSNTHHPSVFQFRIGGCKGVLAVDPSVKGRDIVIRPSQEKFPAKYFGLEICRWSQFTAAYLNVQIILVLNALGVEPDIFIRKMRVAISDIAEVQKSETKAVEQLCRNVDFNRTTLILAEMIYDGFMGTQEPFMVSCLKLWRSWMIKFLKEKARIFVDQGAFVFGCTDETRTLKGHFDAELEKNGPGKPIDIESLPDIFLQIPDPDKRGSYKVIEGVCSLARNPSLHPGDVRVVRAVDVPALNHLKDCVVLPQTGDRGLANMCSGGDLDGDDYLVMWDPDLLPREWNHPAMDYQAPAPIVCDKAVTVEHITSFFVTHMRHHNLGRIATAHKYWADSQDCPEGVKDEKCLELAQLHSKAVDYAKTGVAAEFPKRLMVKRWPHWAEKVGKPSYHSSKVLGRLFDEVQRVPFVPDWTAPFDSRVLNAYQLEECMLEEARDAKAQYDEAVRRIMTQYTITSEFEVWTTFVLNHTNEENDYKFAEKLGETVTTLKQVHQEVCYEKAGTTKTDREWTKLAPFIAAMYTVTAEQTATAIANATKSQMRDGQQVHTVQATFANMPFMSFPWIFAKELGYIAQGKAPGSGSIAHPLVSLPPRAAQKKTVANDPAIEAMLEPLPEVRLGDSVVHEGDMLEVHQGRQNSGTDVPIVSRTAAATVPDSLNLDTAGTIDPLTSTAIVQGEAVHVNPTNDHAGTSESRVRDLRLLEENVPPLAATVASQRVGEQTSMEEAPVSHSTSESKDGEDEDEWENGEVVTLGDEQRISDLDALSKLIGM